MRPRLIQNQLHLNSSKKQVLYSFEESKSSSSQSSDSSVYKSLSQETQEVESIQKLLTLPSDLLKNFQNKSERGKLLLMQTLATNFFQKLENLTKLNLTKSLSSTFLADALDFIAIMDNLRSHFEKSKSNKKKLELMSLLPQDWKFGKISEHINCTLYLYKSLLQFNRNTGKFQNVTQNCIVEIEIF